MTQKIPATVITGFLGAGKTTLVRNLLENAGGRRIALIINEFGDVGVDGDLVKSCGDALCKPENIIELANGCICCTVADDFIPAMSQLLDRSEPPDHIVIETSGLALPQPLVRAFGWPGIAERVTVDAVVTVVDAKAQAEGRYADDEATIQAMRAADPALEHENPIGELFNDQLNCADLVILNKTDLITAAEREAVASAIEAKLRKGSSLVTSEHAQVPVSVLLGHKAQAEADMHNRLSTHEQEGEEQHDHDDFVSFHVDIPNTVSKDELLSRIAKTIQDPTVLRLKGFANVAGASSRLLVQAVGPRLNSYFDRLWSKDETPATQLVVIGVKGIKQDAVRAALQG